MYNFWRSFETSTCNRLEATPRPNIGARVICDISQMALEEHWIWGVSLYKKGFETIYNLKKFVTQN